MINFFRKTRKKMADDNRPLKYMRYAIGEIVLVVIGILIALSINNWNEKRKDQIKTDAQLIALIRSLQVQKKELKANRIMHMFRYNSLQYLLQISGESKYTFAHESNEIPFETSYFWQDSIPDTYDRVFIDLSFSWSGRYSFIEPNTSIRDEFDRSGVYAQIDNFELKDAIDHFYSELKWRIINVKGQNKEKWNDSLTEDGVYYINTSQLDDPIILLRDNPKRIALLKTITGEAHWFAISAKHLIVEVENLILMIEQELYGNG